jgi:hypothetical protein
VTRRTAHFHIGHEVHFDGEHPRALAAFTTPTRDVEREVPGRVSQLARFRRGGKGFSNGRKRIGVGSGIRTRDATEVFLVDSDELIEMFIAFDGIMFAGGVACVSEMFVQGAVENVEDQRRLSRTRDTRHSDQQSQRKTYGDILKIILTRAVDDQCFAIRATTLLRHRDGFPPCQVIRREGPGLRGDFHR